MYASYLPIVSYLVKHKNNNRYKTIAFLYENKIHGIYISEIFTPTKLGLYCAVNSKDRPGSTEWMDWYFFKKMFFEGIQTVYLGGAENKGVDYYIKKLLPDKPSYLTETVEYDPFI